MKKVIIFDFDGVFVNTLDIVYAIHSGRNPGLTREKYLGYLHGNDFGVEATDNHDIRLDDEAFSLYAPKMLDLPMIGGMGKLILDLSNKYHLAIVSSSKTNLIEKYLDQNEIRGKFDLILGLEVGQSKIEKLKKVISHFGVQARDSLFVTDTLGDIVEGKKAGVHSIGVKWGFHTEETMSRGGPLAVVDKPGEILAIIEKYLGDGVKWIYKSAGIVIKDNKLLAVKKSGLDILINLGGKIEPGETEEEALTREVKEEFDCEAKIIRKLGDFENKAVAEGDMIRLSAFLVELIGEIHLKDDEIEDFIYLDKDYLKQGIKLATTMEENVIPFCINEGLLDW